MALTKARIVESLQENIGWSKNQSSQAVETLLELMKRTLESGEDVLISGFGKFRVKEKGERRGRNPATDEEMMLKSRRVVTFKCSARLREKVNGGKR